MTDNEIFWRKTLAFIVGSFEYYLLWKIDWKVSTGVLLVITANIWESKIEK